MFWFLYYRARAAFFFFLLFLKATINMCFKFRCTKSRHVGKVTGNVVNTAVWHLTFQKNRSSKQFHETKQVVEIKEPDLISHKVVQCMINSYLHLFAAKHSCPVMWRSDQGACNSKGHDLLIVSYMKREDLFTICTLLLISPKIWLL